MQSAARVLLVEDTLSLAKLYISYLKTEQIELSHVVSGEEAQQLLISDPPDLVLLDLRLPDMDGLALMEWMQQQSINASVVVMTAHSSVEVAVDAMRFGAHDFLEKPFDAGRLRTTVRNALENLKLKSLVNRYESSFKPGGYHGFVGECLEMQAVYRIIDAVASSKASVFITGESGTGKEVCAEAIHKQSKRAKQPFVALNCGAIPHDLMESEIFGHVKGAFTGAVQERKGAASRADGGTLFLDEIGEMDLELQTKMLRFIQTERFQKVGGSKEEQVDIRIICATNRDPLEEIEKGRFREDLYYRLHVVPIELPALRERGKDILLIAKKLLLQLSAEEGKKFRNFSSSVEAVLLDYPWPGNVRQLQNVIRNIVVLHDDTDVQLAHLPAPLNKLTPSKRAVEPMPNTPAPKPHNTEQMAAPVSEAFSIKPLAIMEREWVERAIEYCDGNVPQAAALLEVSPSTLYRKRKEWQ